MNRQKKTLPAKNQTTIEKQMQEFEKKNPEIAKSLDIFDMSMYEYEKIMHSLSPVRTYTSNSTVAKLV